MTTESRLEAIRRFCEEAEVLLGVNPTSDPQNGDEVPADLEQKLEAVEIMLENDGDRWGQIVKDVMQGDIDTRELYRRRGRARIERSRRARFLIPEEAEE